MARASLTELTSVLITPWPPTTTSPTLVKICRRWIRSHLSHTLLPLQVRPSPRASLLLPAPFPHLHGLDHVHDPAVLHTQQVGREGGAGGGSEDNLGKRQGAANMEWARSVRRATGAHAHSCCGRTVRRSCRTCYSACAEHATCACRCRTTHVRHTPSANKSSPSAIQIIWRAGHHIETGVVNSCPLWLAEAWCSSSSFPRSPLNHPSYSRSTAIPSSCLPAITTAYQPPRTP